MREAEHLSRDPNQQRPRRKGAEQRTENYLARTHDAVLCWRRPCVVSTGLSTHSLCYADNGGIPQEIFERVVEHSHPHQMEKAALIELVNRYKTDPELAYATWFIKGGEWMKAFRAIRGGCATRLTATRWALFRTAGRFVPLDSRRRLPALPRRVERPGKRSRGATGSPCVPFRLGEHFSRLPAVQGTFRALRRAVQVRRRPHRLAKDCAWTDGCFFDEQCCPQVVN